MAVLVKVLWGCPGEVVGVLDDGCEAVEERLEAVGGFPVGSVPVCALSLALWERSAGAT